MGACRLLYNNRIFSLYILTHSCESSTAPRKKYGKGAGSQLPVFTVKSTGIFTVWTVSVEKMSSERMQIVKDKRSLQIHTV